MQQAPAPSDDQHIALSLDGGPELRYDFCRPGNVIAGRDAKNRGGAFGQGAEQQGPMGD